VLRRIIFRRPLAVSSLPRRPEPGEGAWNPGLDSTIPPELRALCTFLRPENVFTAPGEAREIHGLTGLPEPDFVSFRPARLALHEVLIRMSADISVPDSDRIEELGINFRDMTARILARLAPEVARWEAVHAACREAVATVARHAMERLAPDDAAAAAARWRACNTGPVAEQMALRALGRVVSAILVRHGRLWGPRDVIAQVAAGIATNEYAAQQIGELLQPPFLEAVRAEGFRVLPPQSAPVVMNTKGASASGKTTIRPLQRRLAGEIGADWRDFALVSPDIWRKQLLDYGSLGPAFKYAGPFTGEELRIVDQKLDAYMARKAEAGRMTHLLIDRFRFDSFAPHSDEAGSNLLTRFGRTVYLFFMITAPASLVQRAWNRGLEVGRYKAVDDTLAHAIEAYTGMPGLFFTWAERADKRVHFEFLDNEVPAGQRPITAAFGWNREITILDARPLLDVERFRHIDVNARSPEGVFPAGAPHDDRRDGGFLRECVKRFDRVRFADSRTGRVYREIVAGIERTVDEPIGDEERRHTLGRWSAAES
jgi:hypothetical protein